MYSILPALIESKNDYEKLKNIIKELPEGKRVVNYFRWLRSGPTLHQSE